MSEFFLDPEEDGEQQDNTDPYGDDSQQTSDDGDPWGDPDAAGDPDADDPDADNGADAEGQEEQDEDTGEEGQPQQGGVKGFFNSILGRGKGKGQGRGGKGGALAGKSNKPNESAMNETARKKWAVKVPDLTCPSCKQRSIYTESGKNFLVYKVLTWGNRGIRYACLNPNCKDYYEKHVVFKRTSTGKLQKTLLSYLFSKTN